MGLPNYGLRPPRPGMPPGPPIPRQGLMPSPYLDDVISELPEQNPMWPMPQGVGDVNMPGMPPGPPMGGPQGGPPQPRPAPLAPEDPYLTDQIREQTQLSPIKPPPAMPMQLPGPNAEAPQEGQFRAANIPPMGQPGMPPIPPPANARQEMPPPPAGSRELGYLRQVQSQRPELPKPKWWQIAAAAAAGGLEGFLASSPSAAVRSSVRDPGRLSRQIMEGDYPQRMQDWQVDLKNAQALLDASLDIQKARGQQQLQEAQAWRYRNEPGLKADTALEVQQSRNQGAIAKVGATTEGYLKTGEQKYRHTLKPVTPEKSAKLQAGGYEPEGEDEQGRPLFSAATLANYDRNEITREKHELDRQLGQDKLKSAEQIAAENRKSREKLAQYNQGQAWARQEARLRADLQKAQARGETGEYEKEKLDAMAKIENIYHKGVTDLAKRFKFADEYNSKTADQLTGPAAEEYWTERLTLERNLRESKNRAERLYSLQKKSDSPLVYQPEEGETYAEKKLAEIKGKAQSAPGAAQSGQPTAPVGGPAASSQPASQSVAPRQIPGFDWDPQAKNYIKQGTGTRYNLTGNELRKVK